MLQCIVVCCSVLQCVAVCCSLRHTSTRESVYANTSVLQCVAVHCSVLQCVAVHCSVLQYVAVCCSCPRPGCSPARDSQAGTGVLKQNQKKKNSNVGSIAFIFFSRLSGEPSLTRISSK